MEVVGIPKPIESKDLEHTACKVFSSIGFDIGQHRIEACHWLTKSDRTIVRFFLRKGCQYLMHIKGIERSQSNKPEFSRQHQNLCE